MLNGRVEEGIASSMTAIAATVAALDELERHLRAARDAYI